MDNKTQAERSRNMAEIRSKNTKPELLVRKLLFAAGFRYRLHVKDLPGHPDLVFPKYKAVVFINGCFWHAHKGCRKAKVPESNRSFWENKLLSNVARDAREKTALLGTNWRVLTVWQCALTRKNDLQNVTVLITDWLKSDNRCADIERLDETVTISVSDAEVLPDSA